MLINKCKNCQNYIYNDLNGGQCPSAGNIDMPTAQCSYFIAKPATVGIRFLNYILDIVFYYILNFVFGICVAVFGFYDSYMNLGKAGQYLIAIIILFLYYFLLETIFGCTIGKLITGTKVITTSGDRPPLKDILLRTLCRFIPFEAFSFFGESGTGWHDRFSKTIVVKK